jgi:hypothetical protein
MNLLKFVSQSFVALNAMYSSLPYNLVSSASVYKPTDNQCSLESDPINKLTKRITSRISTMGQNWQEDMPSDLAEKMKQKFLNTTLLNLKEDPLFGSHFAYFYYLIKHIFS